MARLELGCSTLAVVAAAAAAAAVAAGDGSIPCEQMEQHQEPYRFGVVAAAVVVESHQFEEQ